jgi:hypothetical protein
MTEAEWLACTDPMPMLEFLASRKNNRKHAMFEVARCRHISRLSREGEKVKATSGAGLVRPNSIAGILWSHHVLVPHASSVSLLM